MIGLDKIITEPKGGASVASAFKRGYEEKRSVNTYHHKDDTKNDNKKDNDDGSLSSLSFYDDFPQLYFAVRKGRFAKDSVFLSWDSARRHIVDYPDAEYIATPTLKQAHSYTNRIGKEFQETETIYCSNDDDSSTKEEENTRLRLDCKQSSSALSALSTSSSLSRAVPEKQKRLSSRGKRKKNKQHSYTTRRLVLEYYELYDPCCKAAAKGKDKHKDKQQLPLTIQKFLKERNMFKSKFKVFAKHWQRSGLLMMSNEEKPLEEAISKYDAWIRDRKLEKFGTDERGIGIGVGKRKRPTTFQDGTSGNNKNGEIHQQHPVSTKKRKINSPVTPSPQTKPKTKKATKQQNKKMSIVANHYNANINLNPDANASPNPVISASILQTATIAEYHAEYNTHTNNGSDEDDDNDEGWNGMYKRLKEFHSTHGHCKVSKSKHRELAYWTQYTRRRMRIEANRSGARALSLREEKLLNDLDFDPVYKEIVTEFNKYLGMRVAKLFDVVDDFHSDNGNDNSSSSPSTSSLSASSPSSSAPISNFKDIKQHKDESRAVIHAKKQPRITTKPFFGTVGRISSVCNRYLRIKYDDGDSEDFDMASLLEGLESYNKYKDKDTLCGVDNTIPSATTTTSTTAAAAVGNNMEKNDKNGENKDDNNIINKISSHGNDIGSSSDANQNKTNNPTANPDNPDGKIDKSTTSDSIRKYNKKGWDVNTFFAASVHFQNTSGNDVGLGDEDKIAKANLGHKSNVLENDATTNQGNVCQATITPTIDPNDNAEKEGRSGGSNSNDNGNKNVNDDNNINDNDDNNINDTGGDSSDEVEIVNVLIPYRGNPNLFGFPKSEGDDAIPKNNDGNNNKRYSPLEEGVFDF